MGTLGFPDFEEQEQHLMDLESYLLENIHASFMTKMKNSNLSSIGILKGDLIIIERRATVNYGDIVLVLTDEHHVFVKAEQFQGKTILRSFMTNDIQTSQAQVIGVIKGVVRKY